MNDIAGEFGGSTPHSLSEYYAGGGLVPSGTTGTYGAVPSSGQISIQNFYGTSNVVSVEYFVMAGGGGGGNLVPQQGAAGGSGIVIVKYAGTQRATGGTVTSAGGFTIHTYTTSGTFSFNYDE
jgi:hypothetical protein